MEDQLSLEPLCSNCNQPIAGKPKFCVNCGFPENGTDAEKAKFHGQQALDRSKTKDAPKQIKSARNTLFIIGGIQLLFSIFVFFTLDSTAELIAGLIVFVIYLLLGFWSQKKPLIALILGLLVYLTLIGISALDDPMNLVKGIIVKVIIIGFLAKGINSALHLQNKKD